MIGLQDWFATPPGRYLLAWEQAQFDEAVADVAAHPDVLAEPWVMTPRTLRLNRNPDAGLLNEATPCRDYDHANMVTQIRH